MSNLTHLFSVDQKVRCNMDGTFYKGTVTETYTDHIIIDIPGISNHCWFENGFNIGDVYPEMIIYRNGCKIALNEALLSVIASYMEDDIREEIHGKYAPCKPDLFLREYIKKDKSFSKLLEDEFEITIG